MSFLLLTVALLAGCSERPLPTEPASGATAGGTQPAPPQPSPFVTFAGVISESETGTPLAGVSVCYGFSPPNCALTGADGRYEFVIDHALLQLPSLPAPSSVSLCPYAFFDGYEQRGACVPLISNRIAWSATLQRSITLEAGRRVRSTIFKGEGSGVVDWGLCEPCKSFNVLVPGPGTLFVDVVPDSAATRLRIQLFYKEFADGALRVTGQDSVQVVVHTDVVPASFELVTSFRPE